MKFLSVFILFMLCINLQSYVFTDSGCQIHLMELSSNGLYLACGSHDGNVDIYSLESLKVCLFHL